MNIGSRIKYFREKIGITQSCLAEKLNISPQAVSKWETGSSYPDITLIPALATYLQVSCDALLMDSVKSEKEILASFSFDESQDFVTKECFFEHVASLEDALQRYPYSFGLMLKLSYLYSYGVIYPEYETLGWKNKITEYCEHVYENSNVLSEKYDAATLLCYTYNGINNDRIIEIANEMPEIYQSKPALIYHGYEGEQKIEGMYNYFLQLLETSRTILFCLAKENVEIDNMYNKIKNFAENRDG